MFGENIKTLRTEAGWSQAELALKACVSVQMISAIEQGTKQPSLPLALGLAKIFNTTVEKLSGVA